MKRGRPRNNQGRNPNQNRKPNPNRALESNGPGIKVRGAASTILEKYTQLAHDATTSGDRVSAEYYYQYAEHYSRLVQAQVREREKREEEQRAQRDARQAEYDARKAARQAERTVETQSVESNTDAPQADPVPAQTAEKPEQEAEKPIKTRRPRKSVTAEPSKPQENSLPQGMQMMAASEPASNEAVDEAPVEPMADTPAPVRRRIRRTRTKITAPAETSET